MNDLRFMIVNSNLPHAQQIRHVLKNRVSFDVFQDTKEQNIWGKLDGGKDDIYVYDRCGRLAYYIPFPLSIMSNEVGNLVPSAILATYYRSPCGTTCEKNSSTLEDFLNNMDQTERPVETTTEGMPITTELYSEMLALNQTDDVRDLLQTNISSVAETIEIKGNHSEFSDFDYPTYDDTLEDYDNNETIAKHDHAFFNTLYRFFFNTATTESPVTLNDNETIPTNQSFNVLSVNNDIFAPLNLSDYDIQHSPNNTEIPPEIETTNIPKPKSDRCAEADPSVCKNWSKKRLLRAHNCCSSIDSEDESPSQLRFCKNFGKKRCKKIKTILKCCIKTALFEVTTQPAMGDDIDEEVTTVGVEVVAEVTEIVCCKDVAEGKLCRVTEKPTCKVGEYIQESVPQIEEAPMVDSII